MWWDLSAQNPEIRVKKRLLDCPNEPPVRIELTTSFYLYGALPLSLGGMKFAGYDSSASISFLPFSGGMCRQHFFTFVDRVLSTKFAGYDFQRKYYVLAVWLFVQSVRLQAGYCLRN